MIITRYIIFFIVLTHIFYLSATTWHYMGFSLSFIFCRLLSDFVFFGFWAHFPFYFNFEFWASNMFYKKQKKILVDVLAWTDEIKEIKSCNVEIDRDLVINVISQSFASFLGCRISPEEPRLALVKNEPVRLLGQTNILICKPKTKQRQTIYKP